MNELPGKRAIGILANLAEPDFDFLRGHFPDFQVVPGDIVRLEAEITNVRRSIGFSNVRAMKDNAIAAEGTLTFALIDRPQS